jgi:hypothetical protein
MWTFNWGIFWTVLIALLVYGALKGIVRMLVVEFSTPSSDPLAAAIRSLEETLKRR